MYHWGKAGVWSLGLGLGLGLLANLYFDGAPRNHAASSLPHPIEVQISFADARLQQLLAQQTHSDEAAIDAYERRRRRAPPPGFNTWLQLAHRHDALMIEEFWDPIYEDLEPFYAIPPQVLRDVVQQVTKVSGANDVDSFWVSNDTAGSSCFESISCVRLGDMLESAVAGVSQELPDLRIPFNDYISPRLWVPWQFMAGAREAATANQYLQVEDLGIVWEQGGDTEAMVRAACPSKSLARNHTASLHSQPVVGPSLTTLAHMSDGVVSDYKLSKSPCHQPDLLTLHGTFLAPNYQLTSSTLFPLFSAQRVADVSPEIRVPSSLYWSKDADFYATDLHPDWNTKLDAAFWRGGNSGGRVSISNWQGFHRHRLVALSNTTLLDGIASSGHCVPWIVGPELCRALLEGQWEIYSKLLKARVNIAFSALGCVEVDPPQSTNGSSGCSYLDKHYRFAYHVPLGMGQKHKYLIDTDGNGFSGRFYSFMLSNSVPIKATIYNEWHESRLVPWKHFVPLDNRFQDLWSVLQFFLGDVDQKDPIWAERDKVGMQIGTEGALWAAKVLRKEDMDLYMARLLLEYGRLYNRE